MSAPTSTSSPRSGSISDDGSIFAFDGAEALLRAWGGGLKPDPLLTVSEWADRYRTLSSRAAAEPGRYRTAAHALHEGDHGRAVARAIRRSASCS